MPREWQLERKGPDLYNKLHINNLPKCSVELLGHVGVAEFCGLTDIITSALALSSTL